MSFSGPSSRWTSPLTMWLDLRWLTSSQGIRKQLVVWLYFVRIGELVEYSYERRCRRLELPVVGGTRKRQIADNYSRFTWQPGYKAAPFPTLDRSRFWLKFDQFAKVVMCSSFIKYAFPSVIEWLLLALFDGDNDGKLAGMEPVCFVPGRFIMHEVIRNEFAACFILINIGYRVLIRLMRRPYSFSLVDFMLQDDEAIGSFYDQFDEATIRGEIEGYQEINQTLDGHPFSQFMCFKIDKLERGSNLFRYRLRANRSREAHFKLKKRVARATMFIISTISQVVLFICLICSAFVLTDFGYLYAYRNCDLDLKHRYEKDTRHRWFYITATPHRLLMILVDSVENFIIWFVSCMTIFYLFLTPVILIGDLILYWKMLHEKIERACNWKRSQIYQDWNRLLSTYQLNTYGSMANGFHQSLKQHQEAVAMILADDSFGLTPSQQQAPWKRTASPSVSEEVQLQEIRWEVRDFFDQIREVGLFMNDLITFAAVTWLIALVIISNAIIKHYVKHPKFLEESIGISLSTLLYTGLPICAIPTTFICVVLFRLYTLSLATYRRLSSLLAYEQTSTYERLRFYEELIEFYVHKEQQCFKLFHMYPFRATSFLSLIGWTVSSLAVLSSLANPVI